MNPIVGPSAGAIVRYVVRVASSRRGACHSTHWNSRGDRSEFFANNVVPVAVAGASAHRQSHTASGVRLVGSQQHLLGDGRDDMTVGVAHGAPQQPAAAGVHEGVHVVEMPRVDARRAVEPHGVIEADHAPDVTVQMQRPSARPGPVRREPEQRGVQVGIVGER